MSFVESFILDPIKHRSFALMKFRFSQLLHERTNGLFDLWYQRWSAMVRPQVKLRPSPRLDKAGIEHVLDGLRQEGCKVLPFSLSESEISDLKSFVFSTPAYSLKITERVMIGPNNIPHDHGRYYWPMHELVACPVVKDLLSDSVFYAIAQEYLGARPVLAHVTLWLDPVFEGYYDPHVYHYDNDGPGFLKFFFYITDVTSETGAHRYIRGSQHHSKPDQFKASRRYEDAELLAHYGTDKEIVFEATAGTVIAEDTAGFHRGSTLVRDYRLLMQFEFSLLDIPHDEDLAGVTKPVSFPEIDAQIAQMARKFYSK